jgi:hypothetical protein
MNPLVYVIMAALGISMLVFPIAVPVFKSSSELSIFNANWNGLSEFAKLVTEKREVRPIFHPYNIAKVGDMKGVILIFAPDVEFSQAEADELKKFLENGGTVFIADDFGKANSLLEKLGIKARFSNKEVKDIFYMKNENFPVVLKMSQELSRNVSSLKLNVPSVILAAEGEILTSKAAYVGKMGEYAVMAELKYGNGRIILFSDPSAFINEMIEENRNFSINLIDYLGTGTFYFDEAHKSNFNPYSIATVYIHRELDKKMAFQIILAVAIFAILMESGILKRIKIKLPKRKENIFENLPEWVDRRKLEIMLKEIKAGSRLKNYGRKRIR